PREPVATRTADQPASRTAKDEVVASAPVDRVVGPESSELVVLLTAADLLVGAQRDDEVDPARDSEDSRPGAGDDDRIAADRRSGVARREASRQPVRQPANRRSRNGHPGRLVGFAAAAAGRWADLVSSVALVGGAVQHDLVPMRTAPHPIRRARIRIAGVRPPEDVRQWGLQQPLTGDADADRIGAIVLLYLHADAPARERRGVALVEQIRVVSGAAVGRYILVRPS